MGSQKQQQFPSVKIASNFLVIPTAEEAINQRGPRSSLDDEFDDWCSPNQSVKVSKITSIMLLVPDGKTCLMILL